MCAICSGAGEGTRAEHHLTHGVSVWLCAAHRSDDFQRRRAGRDFVASLDAVWVAGGQRTKRHTRALAAHLRRVRPEAPARERPGSYAWADLRRHVEGRFQRGENPRVVIADAQSEPHTGGTGPSYRTLRRWFGEARWLTSHNAPRRPTSSPATKNSQTLRDVHGQVSPATSGGVGRKREPDAHVDGDRTRSGPGPIRGPC